MILDVPNAKAALVDLLSARPGLAGVLVRRNLPTKLPAQNDRIYVTDAREHRYEPLVPIPPRTETFIVGLMVESRNKTGDAENGGELAETRLWEILGEIDDQITSDPELGVAVWGSVMVIVEQTCAPTTDGWFAVARCDVHCRTEG